MRFVCCCGASDVALAELDELVVAAAVVRRSPEVICAVLCALRYCRAATILFLGGSAGWSSPVQPFP